MKISSSKNKGRKGQQEIVAILRKAFPELPEEDILSRAMGSQGEDIILSLRARHALPVSIEVKRGKAFNLVNACKQAEANCNGWMPVSMGRYDHDKQWYACVKLEDLLEMLKRWK